jgi:acyl carrier protein
LAKLFYPIPETSLIQNNSEIIPLGSPIPDTRIYILHDGQICGNDEEGEIYIETPFKSKGYFNDPELNKKSFIEFPLDNSQKTLYKTGDIGRWFQNGTVQYIGRKDGQIKLYGQRIEVGEIETIIRQISGIKQVAVTVKKDQSQIDRLVAFIVKENDFELEINTIRKYVVDYLPSYMMPSVFQFIPEIPLTQSGKIDRNSLPDLTTLKRDVTNTYAQPTTSFEQRLSEIWSDVLQVDSIGVEDNFFDLGGNSVLSAQLIAKINNQLNFNIPLVKLFQYPTIRDFAAFLNSSNDNDGQSEINSRAAMRRRALSRRR